MLEIIVDNRLIYVVTGGVTALGVVSKIISNLSLKRMVKAAGNMNKSNHALMRLIRAKFEHACMVSEKVENVQVFVEKYLYEYKTMGLRLHTWRRIQIVCVALTLSLGAFGAFAEYLVNGMNDEVIRAGAYGGILGILLYLFHLTTDENYRLDAARNYMVDYLENVCLHKYEKVHKREDVKENTKSMPETKPVEMPETYEIPEITPEVTPEVIPEAVPETVPPIRAFTKEEARPQKEVKKELAAKEEKKPDKDVLIRQILEEFMA